MFTLIARVNEKKSFWGSSNTKLNHTQKNMEYKGYKILREQIGKFGTSYQYRCGNFIAPRKKDVVNEIDRLLEKKAFLELELSKLELA